MTQILVIDDDDDMRYAITRALRGRARPILEARTAAEGLAIMAETRVGAVVLDLGLPDSDGMSMLEALLRVDPVCRVVVLTGQDNARVAVEALRAGAADYLTKPFERHELIAAVDRAFEDTTLRREIQGAKRSLGEHGVAGSSLAWTRTLEELRALAESSRASVLLCGESGTGKEALARLLHQWSPRASGPFVTVNAACLPAPILESELFGHEAGAFTDAKAARKGLFELAHGGTLFIDEIGEMQHELQPKLLRVLEGHSFRRVGGQREITTDVRLVSATNRDLSAMVSAGSFREDLYFRIRVLQLSLPPLRDRPGDVRLLTAHFIAMLGGEVGLRIPTLGPSVLERLSAHSWPGNVRELKNVIERALVLSRGGDIELCHLPPEIAGAAPLAGGRGVNGAASPVAEAIAAGGAALEDVVRRHILEMYKSNEHNVTRTANALGITRVCLRRHLRHYGAVPRSRAGAPPH